MTGTRFDLTIVSKESLRIRRQVEHALRDQGVMYELWGSSDEELRYEVSVPSGQNTEKLTMLITRLGNAIVDWQSQGYQAVET